MNILSIPQLHLILTRLKEVIYLKNVRTLVSLVSQLNLSINKLSLKTTHTVATALRPAFETQLKAGEEALTPSALHLVR